MSDKRAVKSPPKDAPKKDEQYRHWKLGTVYVIESLVRCEWAPDDFLVTYRAVDGSDGDEVPWARPLSQWFDVIEPAPKCERCENEREILEHGQMILCPKCGGESRPPVIRFTKV